MPATSSICLCTGSIIFFFFSFRTPIAESKIVNVEIEFLYACVCDDGCVCVCVWCEYLCISIVHLVPSTAITTTNQTTTKNVIALHIWVQLGISCCCHCAATICLQFDWHRKLKESIDFAICLEVKLIFLAISQFYGTNRPKSAPGRWSIVNNGNQLQWKIATCNTHTHTTIIEEKQKRK